MSPVNVTDFTIPIPNGTFYSPLMTYLRGPYYDWAASAASGFNFATGTFSGGGGGGGSGTVTQINTGAGLLGGPIVTTGTVYMAPTGVTPGTYTYPVITVNNRGQLTFAGNGNNPLLLTGGTMTGVITFAPAQTFPGQITAISGISPISASTVAGSATVSIASASLTGSGAVQLYNNTNSTSTTLALTAAQGKVLQDQINAIVTSGGLILAGALSTTTGFVSSVTNQGFAAGFSVGSPLPNASTINNNYFVVCDSAGIYTPPGGGATLVNRGDWFFSNGVFWQYFPAGAYYGYASITTAGIIQLSDNTATITGTDSTLAVTPSTLQAKVASNTLIGLTRYATNPEAAAQTLSTVALTPSNLLALIASISTLGLVRLATSGEVITGTDALKVITPATMATKLASTSVDGLVRLATPAQTITGTDSTVVVTPFGLSSRIASNIATGLIRIATGVEVAAGLDNTVALTPQNLNSRVASKTATGLIQLATSAETITGTDDTKAVTPADLTARVATVSATGIVQLVDSITSTSTTTAATPNSVKMALDAAILKATLTGKGSLVSASAATTPEELPAGGSGDFLNVDSTTASGLAWTNIINGGTY